MLLLLLGVARCAQNTQNNKFAISFSYFKKEVRVKYDFLHEDKIKVFCKLVVSFLLVIPRHAERTHNSKFVISLLFAISQKRRKR